MPKRALQQEHLPPLILSPIVWIFTTNMSLSLIEVPATAPVVVVEEPPQATPMSPAPYLNTVVFLGTISAVGFVFFILFRRYPRIASIIAIAAFWLVAFLTLLMHILALGVLRATEIPLIDITAPALGATLLAYLVRRSSGAAALVAASVTAAAGGTIIGYMIPQLTLLVLVASLSVFDLVMVKRGYLSTLSHEEYRSRIHYIRGLVVEVGGINIGLGDLLFYSITISSTFFQMGAIPAIFSNIGIASGYYLTLQLLKRWDTVPGLTIPLLLGLLLSLIARWLVG
ncbi:MAG: hypothetical protein RQ862_10485 [Candidatus Caldarchaeales archaeon]|nr:hypothetical protein [Candidatus Caldarchaeales archaeon]